MRFYALVSADSRETVELYPSEQEAIAALEEALEDEPEWRSLLSVRPIDLNADQLGSASLN